MSPDLLLSHLARGDEPAHEFTQIQLSRVHEVVKGVQATETGGDAVSLSLCNSAGLLSGIGPEDLGRAGIALYGGIRSAMVKQQTMVCVLLSV